MAQRCRKESFSAALVATLNFNLQPPFTLDFWEVLLPADEAAFQEHSESASSPRRTEGSDKPSPRSPVQL